MDENRRILEMVADGKILADEAAKLLEALNPAVKPIAKGRKIRFIIIQEGSEKPKVNIVIPLKLAKFGMSFIPKNGNFDAHINGSNIDLSKVNWSEILEMAIAGETGELFYMEVEEDNGKTVIIKLIVE
jgi:DUF4097 and DUF4098 domain-containing protein YvlB